MNSRALRQQSSSQKKRWTYKLVALVCTLAIFPVGAHSGEIALKCKTGGPWLDMRIDVEKRAITWWIFGYDITKVTDQYITAIRREDGDYRSDVGGEILVFDRVSGQFDLAGVYRKCVDEDCKATTKVRGATMHGVCKRPVL